jgi:hypothetical protein
VELTYTLLACADPAALAAADLPARDLVFTAVDPADFGLRRRRLAGLLDALTGAADPLLAELFAPLLPAARYQIQVTAVAGVPAPYDAWCSADGRLFFNLSQWDPARLEASGAAVILHESAHFLIRQLSGLPRPASPREQLDYLIFDEGLAHYAGFPPGRQRLLSAYGQHWAPAESATAAALARLDDPRVSATEAQTLLSAADSGPYWDKYGSICGMFRAAWYAGQSLEALRACLITGRLPHAPQMPA